MQTLASLSYNLAMPTPELGQGSTSNRSVGHYPEGKSDHGFEGNFDAAISASNASSFDDRLAGSNRTKRPGEPDKAAPAHSHAQTLAAKGTDRGSAMAKNAQRPFSVKQDPPPDLFSSAPSGSPKSRLSSGTPDAQGTKAPRRDGSSSQAAPRFPVVSQAFSAVGPAASSSPKPKPVAAPRYAGHGDIPITDAGPSPMHFAASDEAQGGVSRQVGLLANQAKNAGDTLPAALKLAAASLPSEAVAATSGAFSTQKAPQVQTRPSAARPALDIRMPDGIQGDHPGLRNQANGASVSGDGGGASVYAVPHNATKQDRPTVNIRAPEEGGLDKLSEGSKAAANETRVARDAGLAASNGPPSQGPNQGQASSTVASSLGQSPGNLSFISREFEGENLLKLAKDNQNSDLDASSGLVGASNPVQSATSSSQAAAAPVAQVTVAAQVGQQALEAQPGGRIALLRVETQGSTGRAVVSEVSRGVRAALAPSSDAAALIAQAQVPYLRQAIASLGFAADNVSVNVNADAVKHGQGDAGDGGQRFAARAASGEKPGEIFVTEEVA